MCWRRAQAPPAFDSPLTSLLSPGKPGGRWAEHFVPEASKLCGLSQTKPGVDPSAQPQEQVGRGPGAQCLFQGLSHLPCTGCSPTGPSPSTAPHPHWGSQLGSGNSEPLSAPHGPANLTSVHTVHLSPTAYVPKKPQANPAAVGPHPSLLPFPPHSG